MLPLPRRVGGPRYGEGAAESGLGAALPPEENSRAGQLLLGPLPTPQSGPALPLPVFTAPPRAPGGGRTRERGSGWLLPELSCTHSPTAQREGQGGATGCRSSSNEGAGAAGQNAGSSPGATRQPAPGPRPILFPPEFLSPTPSQGEPGEQALLGPPEGTLEPESRKARMRHWTQGPTQARGQCEEGLGGSPARTIHASPFPTPPQAGCQPQPPALRTPRHPPKHGLGNCPNP